MGLLKSVSVVIDPAEMQCSEPERSKAASILAKRYRELGVGEVVRYTNKRVDRELRSLRVTLYAPERVYKEDKSPK